MIGVVIWGLIVFGNLASRTIISEGSLAFPLLAMAGILSGLWAVARRWAWWLGGLNAATVLVLYAPSLAIRPGTSFSGFNAVVAASACSASWRSLSPGRRAGSAAGGTAAHLQGD